MSTEAGGCSRLPNEAAKQAREMPVNVSEGSAACRSLLWVVGQEPRHCKKFVQRMLGSMRNQRVTQPCQSTAQ